MKRFIFLLLLLPGVAFADDNDCPICTCTLIQRDPTWAAIHDAWWDDYHQIEALVGDYAGCLGYLHALETILKHPLTPANEVILNYQQGITHPVEAFPNDTIFAQQQLDAAEVTLGQFYGEVLACSAKIDALRVEGARRIRVRK